MPIYAYRCTACGLAKDVLQKMSDPVLSTCPACGAETFAKQLTAAGFQLKGSGWYATDFKGSGAAPVAPPVNTDGKGKAGDSATPANTDKAGDKAGDKTGDKAASPAAAPAAPAPASSGKSDGGGGGSPAPAAA